MSDVSNYWREMAKAWEEQAGRNAMLRGEMEQQLAGALDLIKELQRDLEIAYKRNQEAA